MISAMEFKDFSASDGGRAPAVLCLAHAINRTSRKLKQGHQDPAVMARWELRLARQKEELARLSR